MLIPVIIKTFNIQNVITFVNLSNWLGSSYSH